MNRPAFEVADIFRLHGPSYRERYSDLMNPEQRQVMRAIEVCRTAALGGHVDECDHCGHRRVSYNSCRNRHCPKCQSLAKAIWLEKQRAHLLPVGDFHVVFTIPAGSPCRIRESYTIFFSGPLRKHFDGLRRIPSTSAPTSVFGPYFIHGGRIFSCTLFFIAWFQEEDFLAIGGNGSLPENVFSFRFGFSPDCFGDFSCITSKKPIQAVSCSFTGRFGI